MLAGIKSNRITFRPGILSVTGFPVIPRDALEAAFNTDGSVKEYLEERSTDATPNSQLGHQRSAETPVPETPTKVGQAQTYDKLNDWFLKDYVPGHENILPNPTRDTALSAAKIEFPNYCNRTHLREDLRKIWRDHAPTEWKRTGPRAKTQQIIPAK